MMSGYNSSPSPLGMAGASRNTADNDDSTRKRQVRLLKNREAAKECRRKKKEYVKCLENRVAVLENQNKARRQRDGVALVLCCITFIV
uniref:BZIP domain-containing protein n=1 Tax=Parascaris equorum TaxID=6256 RepID=A0A914R7Z8_PAREQ